MERKGVTRMSTKEHKHTTPPCYDEAFKAGAVRMIRPQLSCSRKRIHRLMNELGISSARKRIYKATTNSRHSHPIAPDLLARRFSFDKPNAAWVCDITYIPTDEGWLYCAVVKDLCAISPQEHKLWRTFSLISRLFITPCARIPLLAGVPRMPLLAPYPLLTLPERISAAAFTSDTE